MNTTRLQVFGLRGIDQRWMTDGQDALNIEDMYLTSNDSWKSSGGFVQHYRFPYVYSTPQSSGGKSLQPLTTTVIDIQDVLIDQAFSQNSYGSTAPYRAFTSFTTDGSSDGDGYSVTFDVGALDLTFLHPPTERGDSDGDGVLDYLDPNDRGTFTTPFTEDVFAPIEYESGISSTFNSDAIYGSLGVTSSPLENV